MNDLISRQAAIDVLNKMKIYRPLDSDRYVISDCLNKIINLPSAQPGWIPTSERLPTENNSYLVWMPFAPEGHHITVAEWCGSYWNIKTPIMAWMPLPKPWEGGQDDG